MLVLSRRPDESIVLTLNGPAGEPITVTVLAVEGERVKLGIQAPRSVTVLRKELSDAVQQQNLAAAHAVPAAQPQTLAALNKLLRATPPAGRSADPPTADPPTAPGGAG